MVFFTHQLCICELYLLYIVSEPSFKVWIIFHWAEKDSNYQVENERPQLSNKIS